MIQNYYMTYNNKVNKNKYINDFLIIILFQIHSVSPELPVIREYFPQINDSSRVYFPLSNLTLNDNVKETFL